MKIKKNIERWGSWLLMKQFRLREFNALLGVRDSVGLQELLAEDDRNPPYRGSRGLHALRWMLFDPKRVGAVETIGEPRALLFSFVCDGSERGALEAVMGKAGDRVRQILSHCHEAPERGKEVDYLEARRIKSRYLFRDLGPFYFQNAVSDSPPLVGSSEAPGTYRKALADLRTGLQLAFSQAPDPRPDPTLFEIEDAFKTRDRLVQLLSEKGQAGSAELRQAFRAAFHGGAFPYPLSPVERRLPHEESWTRRLIDTGLKVQDKSARSGDKKLRRAIHAKGHGSIHATLRVLGNEHGVGLFSVQRSYSARLRPSNGAEQVRRDRSKDARGLALRVLIPPDATFANGAPPTFLEGSNGVNGGGYQDFVLMSHPVFFAPDARRLAEWFRILELENAGGWAALAMLAVPGGLRQTLLIGRTRARGIRHPFATTYHSASCYQYGPAHIAKYSVVARDPHRFGSMAKLKDPNSLREALHQSLREGPIVLQFHVHLLPVDAPLLQHRLTIQDVVEDATTDWEELGASPAHVANIEIAQGEDPTTDERLQEAERLRFNPWNSLEEHRPLGSLNRARWRIYRESQIHRRAVDASAAYARSAVIEQGVTAPALIVVPGQQTPSAATSPPLGAAASPPSGAAAEKLGKDVP